MAIKFPTCIESLTLLAGHTPRPQDYLRLAYQYAWENSDDPKTKNGSVLVTKSGRLHYGCNHFPYGMEVKPEMFEPAIKDPLIVHAEEDCILAAAAVGDATARARMYCCWALCVPCAKPIIQGDLAAVITHKQMHDRTYDKYRAAIETAIGYIREAGVHYEMFDGYIGGCEGMMSNVRWEP